nr:MAG TPA_asm: hypothetical protein [Caudoviricetes sp.]DAW01550.1 MAG TPA: hypothetical protein [Caudoviricetes sp.]
MNFNRISHATVSLPPDIRRPGHNNRSSGMRSSQGAGLSCW